MKEQGTGKREIDPMDIFYDFFGNQTADTSNSENDAVITFEKMLFELDKTLTIEHAIELLYIGREIGLLELSENYICSSLVAFIVERKNISSLITTSFPHQDSSLSELFVWALFTALPPQLFSPIAARQKETRGLINCPETLGDIASLLNQTIENVIVSNWFLDSFIKARHLIPLDLNEKILELIPNKVRSIIREECMFTSKIRRSEAEDALAKLHLNEIFTDKSK